METFQLVFNGQELNIILSALAEKPYKDVAGLFNTINMQIEAAREEKNKKELDNNNIGSLENK